MAYRRGVISGKFMCSIPILSYKQKNKFKWQDPAFEIYNKEELTKRVNERIQNGELDINL